MKRRFVASVIVLILSASVFPVQAKTTVSSDNEKDARIVEIIENDGFDLVFDENVPEEFKRTESAFFDSLPEKMKNGLDRIASGVYVEKVGRVPADVKAGKEYDLFPIFSDVTAYITDDTVYVHSKASDTIVAHHLIEVEEGVKKEWDETYKVEFDRLYRLYHDYFKNLTGTSDSGLDILNQFIRGEALRIGLFCPNTLKLYKKLK